MKNILTVTLNPAIDKSTMVNQLVAEQKMSCAAPKYEPGGGGINVSRALKRLGMDSTAIFPAGGLHGQLLKQLLDAEGVEQRTTEMKNWTRENFIVVNSSNNQQYRFGMPGSELYEDEEQALIKSITESLSKTQFIVISGSMPPGISPHFVAKLSKPAKEHQVKLIVDTSGEALKHAVSEGVYLLKPNIGELSRLVGADALDNDSVAEAARQIINEGKCEMVVVSMGAQGAYIVTKDNAEFVPAPSVKKLSTVGAGDSMVAGMVYALSSGMPPDKMVRMGIACGTAATMNPGTELFRKEDAERLYKWLISTNVSS